ncbi:hypothetical protein ACJROX_09200 [Pseudalkalibacillus sp. A8]|uniref:hypothetical protein n=1 Tax=Pseudalkalibacillus sp. A8 TaxID=3382641 RepID=UPI0038B4FCD4
MTERWENVGGQLQTMDSMHGSGWRKNPIDRQAKGNSIDEAKQLPMRSNPLTVSYVMELLDQADFEQMMPGDTSYFTLRSHDSSRTMYGVKENGKFAVDETGVIEITNDQLPVSGYVTNVCGASDADSNCDTYAHYIFDARLNADEIKN